MVVQIPMSEAGGSSQISIAGMSSQGGGEARVLGLGKSVSDKDILLENLEECDENLPKILTILQLQPTKTDSDKNE
jgi:hypothetical protein